jgi:hypothetical protein
MFIDDMVVELAKPGVVSVFRGPRLTHRNRGPGFGPG